MPLGMRDVLNPNPGFSYPLGLSDGISPDILEVTLFMCRSLLNSIFHYCFIYFSYPNGGLYAVHDSG